MRPGLYLHVPFCARVCPYCDFAVLVGDADRRAHFVDVLISEIRSWADDAVSFEGLDSIYFGGGTPSTLEPEQLERILEAIDVHLKPDPEPQIYLEANPEDVTRERLEAWRELGLRTLSLGVQSFDAAELEFLGRLHSPTEASRCVELALEAGVESVSLDLIYGIPHQSATSWRRNLETALKLGPHHLSCYQLTVHRKTEFGVRRERGDLSEMPDEQQADLFELTHEVLERAGYDGYEVSSFARTAEHRSQHNQKYWNHTPYLGLGPSAHSYAGARRWWNQRALVTWERGVEETGRGIAESEELTPGDLATERLMLGLRTKRGVDLDSLERDYGLRLEESAADELEKLAAENLIEIESGCLRPTLRGRAVADAMARMLAP